MGMMFASLGMLAVVLLLSLVLWVMISNWLTEKWQKEMTAKWAPYFEMNTARKEFHYFGEDEESDSQFESSVKNGYQPRNSYRFPSSDGGM